MVSMVKVPAVEMMRLVLMMNMSGSSGADEKQTNEIKNEGQP